MNHQILRTNIEGNVWQSVRRNHFDKLVGLVSRVIKEKLVKGTPIRKISCEISAQSLLVFSLEVYFRPSEYKCWLKH